MTGFGKLELTCGNKKYSIELRCVNSKQMEINVRLPFSLRSKEIEIRNQVSKALVRGKADLMVNMEETIPERKYTINKNLIADYFKEIKGIEDDLPEIGSNDYWSVLLRIPDILKAGQENHEDEQEWVAVEKEISRTIRLTDEFRISEGKILEEDILMHIRKINEYLDKIEQYENERKNILRERILKSVNGIVEPEKYDQNRLEQELIYYIEKMDITEEKIRLGKHCNFFLQTMQEPSPNGKKLVFITQEMGREANTLGVKSDHFEMQRLIVHMKDEIEKIKEQLANIL